MLTDRELLELAAKAGGLTVIGPRDIGVMIRSEACKSGFCWNPITDDGDALRLAVKLQLAIAIDSDRSWSHHVNVMMGSEVMHNGDQEAATRRAIVRAAAELGKVL